MTRGQMKAKKGPERPRKAKKGQERPRKAKKGPNLKKLCHIKKK
jgi:hypothetical protein